MAVEVVEGVEAGFKERGHALRSLFATIRTVIWKTQQSSILQESFRFVIGYPTTC